VTATAATASGRTNRAVRRRDFNIDSPCLDGT
jgi:hypothetical protein